MSKRNISLTKRDVTVMKLLSDFGVVSTDQIGRWLFKDVRRTTVLRRLRLLENGCYIRKRATLPDATAVWVIEPSGMKTISGMVAREFYPVHQLSHEVALNEIRWKFYSIGVVKSWLRERDLRRKLAQENARSSRSKWIIPDALVSFQNIVKDNFHARIEVELTLKSDQRYEAIFSNHRYSDGKTFTWYFVKSEKMGSRIIALAEKYGGRLIASSTGFTVIDEFLTDSWNSRLITANGRKHLRDLALPGAQGLSRQNEQKPEMCVS